MISLLTELLSSEEMIRVKYASSISQLIVNYQQWLNQGASLTDTNVSLFFFF